MPTLSPIDDAPLLPLAGGAPSRTLPAMGSEPPGTDETPADLRAALDAAGLPDVDYDADTDVYCTLPSLKTSPTS